MDFAVTEKGKIMSDYIKREDAIDSACANCIYDEFLSDRKKRIKEGITEIPSADVVEVVRCKDCMHNPYPPDHGNACCDMFYGMTDQMGFCHYGERRKA